MKISSFDKLTQLTQRISDDTTGEISTHLGNNVNYPIQDGIDMFNNAMNQIDTYGNNTVIESREHEKGENVYNVTELEKFIPFLEKVHKARINMFNSVTVEQTHIPIYAGVIPSSGEPVDGNIGINDTKIGYSTSGVNFLDRYRNQLRATALKYFDEDEVNTLLKNVVGLAREFDIQMEGSLIQTIKNKLQSGDISTVSHLKDDTYNNIQSYVAKAMDKILCDNDVEEIIDGYESLSGWAAEEVTPFKMPKDTKHTGSDSTIITKAQVHDAIIREFETGGVTPDKIELLKRLYCSIPADEPVNDIAPNFKDIDGNPA